MQAFELSYWQRLGQVSTPQGGRGDAWIINAGDEQYVYRHYRRGGLVAHFTPDKYLGMNVVESRMWREWKLLAWMFEQGLPVPQPVAARVIKNGMIYSGDILTRFIPNTQTLVNCLQQGSCENLDWLALGKLLRRFHQTGVEHADLNAHNILIDTQGHLFLIDFDRSQQRDAGHWQQRNLARLLRSLKKESAGQGFAFHESDWQRLIKGYDQYQN